jgi:hypothetical protein
MKASAQNTSFCHFKPQTLAQWQVLSTGAPQRFSRVENVHAVHSAAFIGAQRMTPANFSCYSVRKNIIS